MGTHIQKFNTEAAYTTARTTNYIEPWVSKTILTNGNRIDYNKTEEEKLFDTPLTFEILTDGVIIGHAGTSNYSCKKTIEYKKNDGSGTSITSNNNDTATISVVSGDTVQFRGNNSAYCTNSSEGNGFKGTTSQFNIKGNIMSLINSTTYTTLTSLTARYTFKGLFANCTTLISAEKLILPATTLTADCYLGLFNGCTSLTIPPTILPATTLTSNCYCSMFINCTSLTKSPKLQGTTLDEQCYDSMFENCTALTNAPDLPATTLAIYCYCDMFSGCTSLEKAPKLPATTLTNYCYFRMFNGCTSLNYINCNATDISASNCVFNGTSNVSSSGTFIKNANMSNGTTGINGIPTNGTVQDAS